MTTGSCGNVYFIKISQNNEVFYIVTLLRHYRAQLLSFSLIIVKNVVTF